MAEAGRPVCEVCKKPIILGQSWIHHNRLGVDVHTSCPMNNVKGEDITAHTVMWYPDKAQSIA